MTTPEFNAEQAVKKRLGDRHVPWTWIDRGNATQIADKDVTNAYRDALIEAHRKIEEVTRALARNRDLHLQWRREEARKNEAIVAHRLNHLVGDFSRARDALTVVVTAERHGRKTVKVADVLNVYRHDDSEASR